MNEITPGRYRHYKGNEYTVIGTAKNKQKPSCWMN